MGLPTRAEDSGWEKGEAPALYRPQRGLQVTNESKSPEPNPTGAGKGDSG